VRFNEKFLPSMTRAAGGGWLSPQPGLKAHQQVHAFMKKGDDDHPRVGNQVQDVVMLTPIDSDVMVGQPDGTIAYWIFGDFLTP
jgi:hypothetical protein